MKKSAWILLAIVAMLLCACGKVPDPTEPSIPESTFSPTTEPTTEPIWEPATEPTTEPTEEPTTGPSTEPTVDPANLDSEELQVYDVVNLYFAQRTAYLQGKADKIPIAHWRRMDNEAKHIDALEDANAKLIHSNFVIESIAVGDVAAWVTVTETVTYLINGEELQESIFHEVLVEYISDTHLIIRTDGYLATVINFASAAYRDPAMAP